MDFEDVELSSHSVSITTAAPLESVDVFTFEISDRGVDTSGSRNVDILTTNGGLGTVTELTVVVACYDENGNVLAEDTRSSEDVVASGGSTNIRSYIADSYADEVSSVEVIRYIYSLEEADANEYTQYDINYVTGGIAADSTVVF